MVNVCVTTAYLILGKLGLLLAFVHASATAVWPPSGMALAALLLYGSRVWPGILVGAYLVNITTVGTPLSTLGIAIGNTLEALVGMYLVNRFANGAHAFERSEDVFRFAGAALASAVVAATIGVASLAFAGYADWAQFGSIWLTWWLGDAAGDFIIAPLLILWFLAPRPQWTPAQHREAVWLFLTVFAVGLTLFGGILPIDMQQYPLSFLSVPVLVWTGFRFGARETVSALCVLSGLAVWGTLHGVGPFATESPNQSLMLLQAFMAVMSVMSLALTAGVSETQRAHAALREAHDDLDRRVQERTRALEAEILERQRAESILLEKSRLLTQAQQVADLGSWCWDVRSDTVTWSEELYALYGVSPQEFTPTYAGYLNLVAPEDRDTVKQHVEAATRSGTLCQYDHRLYRKDGSVRIIRSRGEVIRDVNGHPIQMIGVDQDITDSVVLERQLHEAQKMEAIGRLAGGIAHDFNNMMMGILGFSELLLRKVGAGSDLHRYIEQIKIAGEQAQLLTVQLLTFSRKQQLQLKVLDLNDLVQKLEHLLHKLIGENIEIRMNLLPTLARVKADSSQLQQVIINLAVNARDAMPTGGRLTIETDNIEITSSSSVPPGKYVRLMVSDTGSGMDAATLSHLFEPFFTTKEKGKGTGLGLSMVYGIVKQSGGHISVESRPGEGTNFTIHLPHTDEPLAPHADTDVLLPNALGQLTATETVLLVEDEEVVRRVVCHTLQGCGYHVLSATNGGEALEMCRIHDGDIHLLLSDVVMPGLSGPEVATQILRIRPSCRIMLMSGYSDNPLVQKSTWQSDWAFLQKPIMPSLLATRIREELNRSPARRLNTPDLP